MIKSFYSCCLKSSFWTFVVKDITTCVTGYRYFESGISLGRFEKSKFFKFNRKSVELKLFAEFTSKIYCLILFQRTKYGLNITQFTNSRVASPVDFFFSYLRCHMSVFKTYRRCMKRSP